MTEDSRRKANLLLACGAWGGAVLLTTLLTSGALPRRLGTVDVLFIGVGVTASLTRMRYKLQDTIAGVFVTGLRTGSVIHEVQRMHQPDPEGLCYQCKVPSPCPTTQSIIGGTVSRPTPQ